jgi:uncharacterized damage-inducible protein DinB
MAPNGRHPASAFFPSLALTLDHLLAVDLYYISALHRDTGLAEMYAAFRPSAGAAQWSSRQHESDLRLVRWCGTLDDAAVDAWVEMPRREDLSALGWDEATMYSPQGRHP